MKTIAGVMLAGLLAGSALANPNANHLDEVRSAAQKVRGEAAALVTELKNKNADLSEIGERMRVVDAHANELKTLIDRLDFSHRDVTVVQRDEMNRLRELVAILGVFVDNKQTLLTTTPKRLDLLRAHAKGIVVRCDAIERAAAKARG
jgi:septal ring factor EnvC (AmiA/AmiB activator)